MKKIEAIIRPEKLDDVKHALSEKGYIGLNIVGVTGRGVQKGIVHAGRVGGQAYSVDMLPKVKLEIGRAPTRTSRTSSSDHSSAARTGNIGDGKIFIMPVDDAIRVRTERARRGRRVAAANGSCGAPLLLDEAVMHREQRCLRAVGQLQLLQDVADMRLHGLFGQHQVARDLLVRSARGRSAPALPSRARSAAPRRPMQQRRRRVTCAIRRRATSGCSKRLAGVGEADRACQLLRRYVLHQVAGRARADRRKEFAVVGEARQDDDARARSRPHGSA